MESWVGTLLKDIREKVGISGPSSNSTTTIFSLLSRDSQVEIPTTTTTTTSTDNSYDYFPSRLSPPELQLLIQYVLEMRLINAGHNLVNVLGRLLFLEHFASENASSAPFLEFDMSKMGHACIAASLGERAWPPVLGYSFVCWFQCNGFKLQQTEHQETVKLRLFSVRSTDSDNTFGEELYLQEDGLLTLGINKTVSLSFRTMELKEGEWYHLAVVQSWKDAVDAEYFSGAVHIYLNGKLVDTRELSYTRILFEREVQITIGTPAHQARVSDLQWKLRSCYFFEEPLSADFIHFMYVLVRGHKVLLQGSGNSHSIFSEDGGGMKFSLSDSTSDSAGGRLEPADNQEKSESNGGGKFWDLVMLEKLWVNLCGKKLLCAFNVARIEALPASQTLTLLNLVDSTSATTFPTVSCISGVSRFGNLYGDVSICRRCIIGNVIYPVTAIASILALIENSETRNMLHIALTLLASALQNNPKAVQQMKLCKGYQLMSLFFHKKMSFFDSQCLDMLFKIAVSDDPLNLKDSHTTFPSVEAMPPSSSLEINAAVEDKLSTVEDHEALHDFSANEGTSNQESEPVANTVAAVSISGALSDADVVEYILLDWTLWVIAPVSIQLKILNFFENLISVYMYKDYNLTVLRERNIVQHLLSALHRDDVEVLVLEKLVILLSIILEHKFIDSELESVTAFVLTTFEPPEVMKPRQVMKETKSKRVTLRNILLETLIDLQVTIFSEELLEKWHTIVSSKLITYFLDEAVHPSSMICIITYLGLCLTSSAVFPLRFESSGGYQTLARVLPSFRDCLDIYYTLFCLMFGKPIYPKLPEVGISDFEALMLSNEDFGELKFAGLLDSVVAMIKSVFDQLRVQPKLAQQDVNPFQASVVDIVEGNKDYIEELDSQETWRDEIHEASLLGWEAFASNATSVLRFMANLAKMSNSFSNFCLRIEFLESCVDLYFSIVRAYMAVKLTKELIVPTSTNCSISDRECDELPSTKYVSQISSSEDSGFLTASHLLLEIDNSGYSGDPSSVAATVVLDLIAEVLSASLIDHINSVTMIENLLSSVPLNLDSESALTFQALCLSRVMNYLERRLLYSDEKNSQKLDKNNFWSNLGSFCNLIVDRVYLGVFPRPSSVIRVLEFCLSMLHSAKKDGQIEESPLPWTGLLSILRGSKPIDVILRSTNQMILYCFLPSFLDSIQEDPLISQEEIKVDISVVLELIHAHKEIIFHPSNVDTDLYCALCINLVNLFSDEQTDTRRSAMSILKYLLVHCRTSLEEVLITKPDNKKPLDVLNGGFNKLLTEDTSTFMRWFQRSEDDVKYVLQQFAGIRWSQFIAESGKFQREKLAFFEDHWMAKMGRKVEYASKLDLLYWDQYIERRSTLAAMQNSAFTELELAYQKKHGLVVHAESEWRIRSEQLGHEHKVELISSLVWEDYWPL